MSRETPPPQGARTWRTGPSGPAPSSVPVPQSGLFHPDDPLRAAFGAAFWRPAVALPAACPAGMPAATAEKNHAILDLALLRLSQSATGRDLLERLQTAGYGIFFDDDATAARGASGLCDTAGRRLVVKSCDDADTLALLLAHEGVHALQAERADDLLPSSRHRPETVFRLAFAIEADAYAQQIQTAFELARGNPSFARPLLLMRARFPSLVRAADRALARAAQTDGDGGAAALADGRVCAAVFNAFYDDFGLRSYYERAHLDWLKSVVSQDTAKSADGAAKDFNARSKTGALFRRDMTGARLRGLLQWRGVAYLDRHRPDIDFTQPRHAGLSAPTLAAVRDFYARHLQGRRMPAVPVFGLLVVGARAEPHAPQDAAVPPSGTGTVKPPRGAGPAIKAPRRRKRDFW